MKYLKIQNSRTAYTILNMRIVWYIFLVFFVPNEKIKRCSIDFMAFNDIFFVVFHCTTNNVCATSAKETNKYEPKHTANERFAAFYQTFVHL